MIDFSKLKFNNKEPIYQQIVDFVKERLLKRMRLTGMNFRRGESLPLYLI